MVWQNAEARTGVHKKTLARDFVHNMHKGPGGDGS
jgi:hypothetical protein